MTRHLIRIITGLFLSGLFICFCSKDIRAAFLDGLSGLLALRQGDVAEAQRIFDLLAADPFAPAGIRSRAEELSGAIAGE